MNYLKLWVLLREDLEQEVSRTRPLRDEDMDDPWLAMLVSEHEKAAFQKVLSIMKSREYELAAE